jgi:hypothetical protein
VVQVKPWRSALSLARSSASELAIHALVRAVGAEDLMLLLTAPALAQQVPGSRPGAGPAAKLPLSSPA